MAGWSIREAHPDHSEFLAGVILSASRSQLGRGPFDIAFRMIEDDLLALLEWVTLSEHRSSCHFSKFLVVEADDGPVGALSIHDPGEPGVLPLGAALADAHAGLGYDPDELAHAMASLEVMQRCLAPAQPGTWVVEWVAVKQEHRRHGIASSLLRECLALAERRALQRAQVSTYIGNRQAISVYERVGFRVDRERRDAAFAAQVGAPGMVIMVREAAAIA